MSQNDIHEIEMSIEEYRETVERGKMVQRLEQSPEFRKLIIDGYFVNEAARLVHLSSDPTLTKEMREDVFRMMSGVAGLKRYLSTIVHLANQAYRDIEESQEELEVLRAEEFQERTYGGVLSDDEDDGA